MQEKTTSVAPATAELSEQNTSDPLTRHYQQQPTVRENKRYCSGERNQEEVMEVDRTNIGESIQLHHKLGSHMESSRLKEKRKTKEQTTPGNGNRHGKNEQELDGTRKEGSGQTYASVGLNIHKEKAMILKYNTENTNTITLNGKDLEYVELFTYLDSILNEQGGSDADVKTKSGKASAAFLQLRNIWNSKQLSINIKIRIFNTNIKIVGSILWN
ncbi:unnamed protein product [Schistosoma margrebowiei]|uniref:Uncharacterized protein n=1 Tax=Schistosoma margrebowiei TaxID=48269 RepID=A0A183LKW7_9TREM|nr:unnamed protein product [Schistosoma margrebowiei]